MDWVAAEVQRGDGCFGVFVGRRPLQGLFGVFVRCGGFRRGRIFGGGSLLSVTPKGFTEQTKTEEREASHRFTRASYGSLVTVPQRLILATHNPGKLGELRKLLGNWDCELLSVGELGAPVPEESSDSFQGNALLKARAAARQFGSVALGDDGGLVVPELGGVPGVHSSRWVAKQGGWINARERLIFEAGLRDGPFRRVEAILHCALAYATPDGVEASAESSIVGQLRAPLSEDHEDYGPGFLPVFEADDPGLWIDEVLVHRRRAFAQLEAGLAEVLGY